MIKNIKDLKKRQENRSPALRDPQVFLKQRQENKKKGKKIDSFFLSNAPEAWYRLQKFTSLRHSRHRDRTGGNQWSPSSENHVEARTVYDRDPKAQSRMQS